MWSCGLGLISSVRTVNGNPTMLDLGGIPAILEVRANGTLELRDMLLKNVASEAQLHAANSTIIRPDFTRVSGAPDINSSAYSSHDLIKTPLLPSSSLNRSIPIQPPC